MVKSCIKKLYKSFKWEISIKFVTQYKTTKMSFFANTKDETRSLSQSCVVYKFACLHVPVATILVKQSRLYMKEWKNMLTATRRPTNKVQFMNICQFTPFIVTYWTCWMLIIMMLTVTNLTLTRLEVTLLFLKKQIIGRNCYLKSHKPSLNAGLKVSKYLQLLI